MSSPASLLAEPAASIPIPISGSAADWSRRTGSSFTIRGKDGVAVVVELTEVKVRPPQTVKPGQKPREDAGNERFSLFFSGKRSQWLSQDTYSFWNVSLGSFDLFIVPHATKNGAGVDFEAVINRAPKN